MVAGLADAPSSWLIGSEGGSVGLEVSGISLGHQCELAPTGKIQEAGRRCSTNEGYCLSDLFGQMTRKISHGASGNVVKESHHRSGTAFVFYK